MNLPIGKIVRVREHYCFIRANESLAGAEYFAHETEFPDGKIPPLWSLVEFMPVASRRPGGLPRAEFCRVLDHSE